MVDDDIVYPRFEAERPPCLLRDCPCYGQGFTHGWLAGWAALTAAAVVGTLLAELFR